jgi:hypothetical protein
MYLEISISQSRLVEFIHIFLQEYRETKIVLVFLFLKLKSWLLVERDYRKIKLVYWVMEGTIYHGWETQGVAAPRGKP